MTFCGCVLKPGKTEKVKVPKGEIWHLSQVCLHEPLPGKTYVQVEVKGTTYTLACLEKDKAEHNSLDLFFGPEDAIFSTRGKSEVHLLGYLEPMEDQGDEDLEDEEEEEEDEEKTPAAAKSKKEAPAKSPKVEAKASPKAEVKASPKAEAKASPKAAAKAAAAEEDEDDEEGEEEELEEGEEEESGEEDEEVEVEKPAAAAKDGKQGAKAAAKEDKKAAAGEKRKAEEAASPAGKKAKGAAAGGSAEAEYVQQLVAFLKKNGTTDLSKLGSSVKRPADVPKMRVVLSNHKDKFALDGEKVAAK